jgi:hypothetical protein
MHLHANQFPPLPLGWIGSLQFFTQVHFAVAIARRPTNTYAFQMRDGAAADQAVYSNSADAQVMDDAGRVCGCGDNGLSNVDAP